MELKFDYQSIPNNFTHCFNERCTEKERCLRYQVGRYLPADRDVVPTVNPHYAAAGGNVCRLFKPAEPVRMAEGITHLFDSLPYSEAVALKKKILTHFGRNLFYAMKSKKRYVYPDEIAYIRHAFQQAGITEEPHFDSWVECYEW